MAVQISCIVAVLLASVLPTHNSLPSPGAPDFSSNFLEDFGNSSFQLEGSSIVQLPSGDGYIITGAVTSPSGFVLPTVCDEPDVKQANTKARMGLVLRISTSGKVVWGKRTCVLPKGVSLSAAVSPGGGIFIAGARLVANDPNWHLLLARYAVNGTLEFQNSHGTGPEQTYYSAVVTSGNDSVLLVANLGISPLSPSGDAPGRRSGVSFGVVAVAEAAQGNGTVLQRGFVTRATNGYVMSEHPWGAALSPDRATVYVLVRHTQLVNGSSRMTDTVYAQRVGTLEGPPIARIDLEYVSVTRPQLGIAAGALLVAQVFNVGSARKLRVTRLNTSSLAPANWTGAATHVRDLDIPHDADENRWYEGMLARILTSAWGPRVVLSTDADLDHVELGVLRPSVIELAENGTVIGGETAKPERIIIATDAAAVGRDTVVLGTDITYQNSSKLYLAIAGGSEQKTEERATGNLANDAMVCIGVGTVVNGLSIKDEIRRRGLRRQLHPVRLIRMALGLEDRIARVLCFNKKGSRICATPGHILYVDGEARYMHEVCESLFCESEIQEVINFKSGCGSHIELHEGLSISMHSGSNEEIARGKRAVDVANDECSEQKNNWIRWVMSTL